MKVRGLLYGVAMAAAIAVRGCLAVRAPAGHDITFFWEDIARRLEAGARLYEDTAYHFAPLWAWLLLLFQKIARHGFPFAAALRLFLNLVDLASAVMVFSLARRYGSVSPWRAALFFLANPVMIWVSSVQGQFDNMSLFFLMGALLVSDRVGVSENAKGRLTGFFLFLSVASKQVSLLHPLLWLRRRKGVVAVANAYVLTLVLLLPYAGQWRAIRDHLLAYRSVPRSYGFSEWVLYDSRMADPVGLLNLIAGVAAVWLLRDKCLARASLLLFIVLLFFAPGLGSQYLIWPLTLGSVFGGAGYWLCTASSILWILGSHYAWIGSGQFMGHLIWLSLAFWGVRELRVLRGSKSSQPDPSLRAEPALNEEKGRQLGQL